MSLIFNNKDSNSKYLSTRTCIHLDERREIPIWCIYLLEMNVRFCFFLLKISMVALEVLNKGLSLNFPHACTPFLLTADQIFKSSNYMVLLASTRDPCMQLRSLSVVHWVKIFPQWSKKHASCSHFDRYLNIKSLLLRFKFIFK